MMRVLVACEYSGVVRRAFRALGHDAWSCDLLPAEDGAKEHYQCDVMDLLNPDNPDYMPPPGSMFEPSGPPLFDLMIAHPPCTHMSVSGARWFKDKRQEQEHALDFVRALMAAPIERIAIENPISVISSRIRKPDQIIQPWQFGHGETKATCLWLQGLPKLTPTNIVEGREARIHRMPPGPDRWKERSRTFTGIAAAMAEQWGKP
jgi:site-specific DNA-cytosine methylase